MALIIPGGPCFAFDVSNTTITTSSTTVTTGTANADGAVVTLLSALARDLHHLVVSIGTIQTSTLDNSALADIMIDPAGGTSWSSLVDDLLCGWATAPTGTADNDVVYQFPLWIPAGASIGMRIRKAGGTASSATVRIYGFGDPRIRIGGGAVAASRASALWRRARRGPTLFPASLE
jgi:hypothetical protein